MLGIHAPLYKETKGDRSICFIRQRGLQCRNNPSERALVGNLASPHCTVIARARKPSPGRCRPNPRAAAPLQECPGDAQPGKLISTPSAVHRQSTDHTQTCWPCDRQHARTGSEVSPASPGATSALSVGRRRPTVPLAPQIEAGRAIREACGRQRAARTTAIRGGARDRPQLCAYVERFCRTVKIGVPRSAGVLRRKHAAARDQRIRCPLSYRTQSSGPRKSANSTG